MQGSEKLSPNIRDWVEVFMRNSMRNVFHYSKQTGISMSQIGALFQIHRKGVCGVSDIGEDLGITNAGASQILERLVNQGLVIRSEDTQDRRVKKIVLTEKGHRVMQESLQARQDWLAALVELLTPQEQVRVTAALNLLVEKAHQLETHSKPDS